MRRLGIIFLLLAFFAGPKAFGSQKGDLLRENGLIESELKVARQPKIYVVFDLRSSKVLIKARGMELTEFRAGEITIWGNPLPARPLVLSAKYSFMKPERKKIEPAPERTGDEGQDTFKLEVREVREMPPSYVLYLDGGVSVRVRPLEKGITSRLLDAAYSPVNTLVRSFYSAWSFIGKKPFSEVDITLRSGDARTLYWILHVGTPCILSLP